MRYKVIAMKKNHQHIWGDSDNGDPLRSAFKEHRSALFPLEFENIGGWEIDDLVDSEESFLFETSNVCGLWIDKEILPIAVALKKLMVPKLAQFCKNSKNK